MTQVQAVPTLSAQTIHACYRPEKCELRPYLVLHGEKPADPGPYEEVLFRLGQRYEQDHLKTLGAHVDLRAGTLEERAVNTKRAIQARTPILYQPVFQATHTLDGQVVRIVGIPDLLIWEADGYVIRDVKLARHATEEHHPEILRQCDLYGWLMHANTGTAPKRLEVLQGDGNVVNVPFSKGATALADLARVVRLARQPTPPYAPVGWSKCIACGFRKRCWDAAEAAHDVALVYGVDQGLARALHQLGCSTVAALAGMGETKLSAVEKPWGARTQRVGKAATKILRQASAMMANKPLILSKPNIPAHGRYVMFDLEGLPPQLDELDKVYLWGMQVFGDGFKGEFVPAVAGFGVGGDKQGWMDFLAIARRLLDDHDGTIRFVHWHHYEKTKIGVYEKRFGDPDGTAARVKANLLDLHPITLDSVVIPDVSYSLKVVEKLVGFKRQLAEGKGDWSMARYIEAVETQDEAVRRSIMNDILQYNQEDLEATWAILAWLRSL